MQPNRFGRVVGVGARVAAEKLRQKAAEAAAAPPHTTSAPRAASPAASAPPRPRPDSYLPGPRRLARGAGRFGASMWRPFAHATGVLWLQITGVFFALFTLFFVVHATQVYSISGWHDRHVIVYAALAVLFAWFAVTSFWRARSRQKKG